MLSAGRLKLALQIHSQSYRLLRWVGEVVAKGLVPAEAAHHFADAREAAHDWMSKNLSLFPSELQPDRRHLRQYANFFGTYVTSSFDIVAIPEPPHERKWKCDCDLCVRLANASNLRTKKLLSRDKKRANCLMEDRLIQLASEAGLTEVQDVSRFVLGEETRRSAAYSTYGYWLIRRLDGDTDGPAVLALWREIAWSKAGSPLPNFKLEFNDFVAAEELLVTAMQKQTVQ